MDPKQYLSIDMSPSGIDFDFCKSIDLDGHIFLVQCFAKNQNLAQVEQHFSYASENLRGIYSIKLNITQALMCPLVAYILTFRKSIDLGGHIF